MNSSINLLLTHHRNKLYSFIIPFFLLLLFITPNNYSHPAEFRMHVGNGSTVYGGYTVYLYDLNFVQKYVGTTNYYVRYAGYKPVNFVADMTDGLMTSVDDPSMVPVAPGSYYIRIDNRYARLDIDPFTTGYNADFEISLIGTNGTFVREDDPAVGRPIYLGPTYNWVEHTITVKNSFGGGKVTVDGTLYNNIGVNGKTFTWIESSTHTLNASDQPFTDGSGTFMRRFQEWTDLSTFSSFSRQTSITVPANDNTYIANFKNEYNITFQNSFSGATGGIITVNGSQNAPYLTTALEDIGILAIAVSQTINGISYSFSIWSNSSTSASTTFYPDDHKTYTANFTGKPTFANRGLTFLGIPGHPRPKVNIQLSWNEHPHDSVKYKIWRKVKHNGVMGSASLIATVNHGTTTYTDVEYAYTPSYTDDLIFYDVKAYYTIESTSSDDNYVSVFGVFYLEPESNKTNMDALLIVTENSLDNYPNPFNPSTIIQYQIKESGFVSIKVYDYLGREVAVLVNKEQPSGRYSVTFDASSLSSGVYLYTINVNNFHKVKKMILLR